MRVVNEPMVQTSGKNGIRKYVALPTTARTRATMIFNIPQGANMLYPERPIGYSVPRENYYVPGWQPEYVIFAQVGTMALAEEKTPAKQLLHC